MYMYMYCKIYKRDIFLSLCNVHIILKVLKVFGFLESVKALDRQIVDGRLIRCSDACMHNKLNVGNGLTASF